MTKKQIEKLESKISNLQRDKRSLIGELYETEDKHECYAIEMEVNEIDDKITELRKQITKLKDL